jgi:hypothetical protein
MIGYLAVTAQYLEKHARRANMKRDKDIPLFKYGSSPAMAFNDVVKNMSLSTYL